MPVPALFASRGGDSLVASESWFQGTVPVSSGKTVPFAEAAASLPRDEGRSPVVVVDAESLSRRTFTEHVVKGMRVKGRDIWLMTWIEDADDVFDAFNTTADTVIGPLHSSRSDADLEDILSVSDSFVPAVFAADGRAVLRKGRTGGLFETVTCLERMGFHRVCVVDTDGRVSGYDWETMSEAMPSLIAFTGPRTTSAGRSQTWICTHPIL